MLGFKLEVDPMKVVNTYRYLRYWENILNVASALLAAEYNNISLQCSPLIFNPEDSGMFWFLIEIDWPVVLFQAGSAQYKYYLLKWKFWTFIKLVVQISLASYNSRSLPKKQSPCSYVVKLLLTHLILQLCLITEHKPSMSPDDELHKFTLCIDCRL